jgi:uncharacterized protein (TIGR02145 family)
MKTIKFLSVLLIASNLFGQSAGSGMTDIDGNLYSTVIIGTQEWVSENLNVSKYNDGTVIPQVTDPTAWDNLTTGAWCYYNNDATNGSIYGKLYNYYAIAGIHDTIASTPNKVLAPIGFHVPTDTNWTTLSDHLGGFLVAGGEMKEIGTAHWMSPNTGATNSSGFTGLADGFRFDYGIDYGMGLYANWWSSTLHTNITTNTVDVWIRHLDHDNAALTKSAALKEFGFSVRLLNDTLFSDSPTNIETIETQKINIYPNPTHGDFTITGFELLGTVYSLTLTDMNGKVVRVLDAKATKFNMASIKPGVYFLNIISGNKHEVLKIVKE